VDRDIARDPLLNLPPSRCYIPELDLIAVFEQQVIGHIISTKARVIDTMNIENEDQCNDK
jgi:predicted N-acetyltransferase YhbS